MSKYADLKIEIKEFKEDLKTEKLKVQRLDDALKKTNIENVTLSSRNKQLKQVCNMLEVENKNLKSFNESKTESISNLISQNITKDTEISSLRFMINEMKGW